MSDLEARADRLFRRVYGIDPAMFPDVRRSMAYGITRADVAASDFKDAMGRAVQATEADTRQAARRIKELARLISRSARP